MSRRSSLSVRHLADEASLDIEEAIVLLWDAGFTELLQPNDLVQRDNLGAARKALGTSDLVRMHDISYWVGRSGLSHKDLLNRMRDAGVHANVSTKRIPKNSLKTLSRLFPETTDGSARVETPVRQSSVEKNDEPFELPTVGTSAVTTYIRTQQVIEIHELLTADFADTSDPIFPPGVKNYDLLDSAIHRPLTSLGEVQKYPTVPMAAAALFHSIIHNHAFHNGNKRTALVTLLAFLDINGFVLTCSQEDLFRFTLLVAQHALVSGRLDQIPDREVAEIAEWIRHRSRRVDREDKPMRWHKLKARLIDQGCELQFIPGNRVNIYGPILGRARIRKRRQERLHTQVACSGLTSECDKSTVRKIRKDLELDDAHGVDSTAFYEGSVIDSFIIDYRPVLRRLARL